jgi:hypothetical protein
MSQDDIYTRTGQLIKILPIPYALNIFLLLIWPPLGSVAMLAYWTLVLVLSRQLSSLAAAWKDTLLASSGTWLLLAAIAGLSSTALNFTIPINAHLEEMSYILDTTADPGLAIQLIAPYIINIMANAMLAAPLQILVPAACGLIGWIKLKAHVTTIADVQRYVVGEGIQKLLVAHKLQIAMGLLLVGTIASIWGAFASIAASGSTYGLAIVILLVATLVLGIGVIVTAVAAFFTLVAGFSKAGNALVLIRVGRGIGGGEPAGRGRAVAETRCGACGNTFPSQTGIKYCPVCGAALP